MLRNHYRYIPAIYGTILMTLAIVKAVLLWKEARVSLARILVRDQVFYFVV